MSHIHAYGLARQRTREDPASQTPLPHPSRMDERMEEGQHDNSPRYGLTLFYITFGHFPLVCCQPYSIPYPPVHSSRLLSFRPGPLPQNPISPVYYLKAWDVPKFMCTTLQFTIFSPTILQLTISQTKISQSRPSSIVHYFPVHGLQSVVFFL
jgi:hypothetical protein